MRKQPLRVSIRSIGDLRAATELYGLHANLSPHRILNQAAIARTNEERLALWKIRWEAATGITPTEAPYTVAHCRTCKRPHWFNQRSISVHLTARCPGH